MNLQQDETVMTNVPPPPPCLPVPLIDHVVVNVAERMEQAASLYARLGFTLTPLGRHTLGTINHLAMFCPDYLELFGVPAGSAISVDAIAGAEGLSSIAFATDDADAVHAALVEAGAPVMPALDFSRPVALPDGPQDAAFRIVRIAPDAFAAGRLFFCQHRTRALVWRNEWRRHGNGALGIAGVVIAASRPEAAAGLFRTMFGMDAVVEIAGGVRLLAGLASIDVLAPTEVARRYGTAVPAPEEGRPAAMRVLRLRVGSIERVGAVLRDGGLGAIQAGERLLVPAAAAFGVTLEFCLGR